jgi:transcriptional regulator with XRE-family HTH domain
MTYGKRLEKAMEAAGKTRKELAATLGCSPQAVGMVITGAGKQERFLSVENHAEAARFLRVDSYWLATGKGEMRPSEAKPTDQSSDAAEIAAYFDMLTDKGDRTRAYVAAMGAILKVLADRDAAAGAQATALPEGADSLKTPRA